MSRVKHISIETATGPAKTLLEGVQTKLGLVPNMMQAMANSPAVLDGYLKLNDALAHGSFTGKVREQLALAVSEVDQCEYCVAAHSAIGKMFGLTAEQIHDSRLGTAVDAKVDTLLRFARKVVETRGIVSEADLEEVRDAGFDDGAIAEVVANVALSILTNYFNNVVQTDIDFPRAPALTAELV